MKKILFAIVAIAAITFTACDGTAKGGLENDSIPTEDSLVVAEAGADVDQTIEALTTAIQDNDPEKFQTLLQQAQAYITKLQAEGNLEEESAYLAKLQKFIADNEEKVTEYSASNETFASVVAAVKAIPTDAAAAAADVAEDAKTAAKDAKSAVKDAANDAANQAVETGKAEAGKAIDKAASDIKGKLGL
ncbi:MAG: hypothetical protein IJP75_01940 [Bacteroidaceae bacterium]|nr:hypothetical protein [Bacteroidaceae bacterium]